MSYEWRPYVPVAARRLRAARAMATLGKTKGALSPVAIDGRTIAKTFWGKAWCDNLEHYSDYANRLPRGRTYVRNGSVIDLQVAAGEVKALVSGSRLYTVALKVTAVPKARWSAICKDCAGAIDSLVELLQGRLSQGVMERICRDKTGLFPAPDEIALSCSCPDWASMCKHVAAVLYGIGARLDERPELLFKLRAVNEKELIAKAGSLPLGKKGPAAEKVLDGGDLAELFGLEMAQVAQSETAAPDKRAKRKTAKAPAGRRKAARGTRSKSARGGASGTRGRTSAPKKKRTPRR